MAFSIFTSGASDADAVNANFYHIAQGTRLPRGGTSLDPTTGIYDVGSGTYKWNSFFVNSLSCANLNITGSFTSNQGFIVEQNFNCMTNEERLRNFVINLSGADNVDYYLLHLYELHSTTSCVWQLYLNGDSDTANYAAQNTIIKNVATTITIANVTGTITALPLAYNVTTTSFNYGYHKIIIKPETENSKLVIVNSNYLSRSSNLRESAYRVVSWDNTSDTLSSLVFAITPWTTGISSNINLRIFKKLKSV